MFKLAANQISLAGGAAHSDALPLFRPLLPLPVLPFLPGTSTMHQAAAPAPAAPPLLLGLQGLKGGAKYGSGLMHVTDANGVGSPTEQTNVTKDEPARATCLLKPLSAKHSSPVGVAELGLSSAKPSNSGQTGCNIDEAVAPPTGIARAAGQQIGIQCNEAHLLHVSDVACDASHITFFFFLFK